MDELHSNNIDSAREIDDKERERAEDMADEADDEDYKMHLKAGLQFVGYNEDGEREYIGKWEHWAAYRNLQADENLNN